jgi:hypothetical protein
MMWGTVWEFRQMSTLSIKSPMKAHNNLILSSRYQDLTSQLEDFRINCPPMNNSVEVMLELMLVHLNAPLDAIQLFAGIEGQEEARSAYHVLREWVNTVPARQALWNAGQILRAAEGLPKGLLCNFNAIAVYHASLILWGYGFLSRSKPDDPMPNEASRTVIVLNGEDSLDVRRFITASRGIPSIRVKISQEAVKLSNVVGVMDGLIHLLQASHGSGDGSYPPLVGNLVQLLEGLGSAIEQT